MIPLYLENRVAYKVQCEDNAFPVSTPRSVKCLHLLLDLCFFIFLSLFILYKELLYLKDF